MNNFSELKQKVIDTDLCLSCGSCSGACPEGCLETVYNNGRWIPELKGTCVSCSLCCRICPGINQEDVPIAENGSYNKYLGAYDRIFVGCSSDEEIRNNSSSGGIATHLLIELIESALVDKVSVLGFDEEKRIFPLQKTAASAAEIKAAAQSKYVLYPSNDVLKIIRDSKERYALVALPCQISALRKLLIQPEARSYNNISYIIGLYCGLNLYHNATIDSIRRLGIKDTGSVKSLSYRSGKWPGYFSVENSSGSVKSMSKAAFNYLSFFYTPYRCLLCRDLSSEYSDISIADAWGYKAKSLIISRRKDITEKLREMASLGKLEIDEIEETEAISMHSHGLDNKKRGASARVQIEKKKGKPVPEADPGAYSLNRTDLFYNSLLLYILNLGTKPAARKISAIIPVIILEKAMICLKAIWKIRTKKKT